MPILAAFLCAGWVGATAVGQTPVVIAPALSAPPASASGSTCSAGFAEIVATHFRVSQDPHSAVLPKGMLHIKARRGWIEERGSAMVSYRDADGTVVPEIDVPIHDGALDHPACVPFTSVYVTSPVRYEMTVTDDKTGSILLLLVTADMTQPRYRLDDDGLYRTAPDGTNIPGSKTPLASTFKECVESSWCGRE